MCLLLLGDTCRPNDTNLRTAIASMKGVIYPRSGNPCVSRASTRGSRSVEQMPRDRCACAYRAWLVVLENFQRSPVAFCLAPTHATLLGPRPASGIGTCVCPPFYVFGAAFATNLNLRRSRGLTANRTRTHSPTLPPESPSTLNVLPGVGTSRQALPLGPRGVLRPAEILCMPSRASQSPPPACYQLYRAQRSRIHGQRVVPRQLTLV